MDWDKKQELEPCPVLSSSEHEARILQAHVQKEPITPIRLNLSRTSLNLPKTSNNPARQIELTDTNHPIKAPLYRAILAAYNFVYFNETAPPSNKLLFGGITPDFVNWLNTKVVGNQYLLLKEYETDWFDVRSNHGSPSPLIKLKTVLFRYAFEESEFNQGLTRDELNFLKTLSATKMSLHTNKKQDSLASYFGAMPWLRDDEMGVGADLYNVLASPKLTISSLKAMVSTCILEFYEAKIALRGFLLSHPRLVEKMRHALNQKDVATKRQYRLILCKAIYSLFEAFNEISLPSEKLANAMLLLAVSSLTTLGMKYCLELTKSKTSLYEIFKYKDKEKEKSGEISSNNLEHYFSYSMGGESPILPLPALLKLSNPNEPFPITTIEQLMFSWLMASLTVQPDNITKLEKNDFRIMKVGQRVTDIECEYFKGRANAIHTTTSVSVKKNEGKALLAYLNQHAGKELQTFKRTAPSITPGGQSVIGNLMSIISLPFMNIALQRAHHDVPMVLPKAIQSLARFGVNQFSLKGLTKNELPQAKTFSKRSIFNLRAIKNSAVHAYSDPYTLQYLINRNSHSSQTEKTHYLNKDNEEWINASGRITRSVMFDLINNVFDLGSLSGTDDKYSKQEVAKFNFEFENVSQLRDPHKFPP